MAITSQIRIRSISLPSRIHPINPMSFENELEKLKSCQASSVRSIISSSSEAIEPKILVLAQLYNSVQELEKSPSTQQALVLQHHQDANSLEESLDQSVQILNACSKTRDLLLMIKENVQTLQSSMRRKSLDCSSNITAYFNFRKHMKKSIAKTIKKLDQKSPLLKDRDSNFITLLKEVAGITSDVLKSVLFFLSCTKVKSSRWSLVSKMVLAKSLASKRGSNDDVNEVEHMEFDLHSLQEKIKRNVAEINDVQTVQKRLKSVEACIERLEGGLERMFRQLVQCRVTLLNILTDH